MPTICLAFTTAVPLCAPGVAAVSVCSPLAQRLGPLPRVLSRRSLCMRATPEKEIEPVPVEPAAVEEFSGPFAGLQRFMSRQGALKAEVFRNYGVAAFLAYGMFDALTYSVSFLLALRGYIAAGKVLTLETLPQVLALMWGINNLSRPFRIAGALALAPVVDSIIVKPFGKFISRLRTNDGPN